MMDEAHAQDVIVVGAGPAGLTLAILLGRAGIRTTVLERRPATSTHPRAHQLNERTMELMRTLGLEQRVRDVGLPMERSGGFGWMTRITGEEIGRILIADHPEMLMQAMTFSPSIVTNAPQDSVEPILLEEALRQPSVEVRFGTEVVALEQSEGEAAVTARAVEGGAETTLSAAYVVGADGARSRVRRWSRIEDHQQAFGDVLNIYFHADLTAHLAGRPYVIWWIVNPDVQGGFIAMNGDRWVFNFGFDSSTEGIEDYPEERCRAIVRAAVGDPDLEVDVRSVLPWKLESAVAERYRDGRVFLAGDAAHRFPPTGALGMNTSIQDAHNLAWKLVEVVRGRAGVGLLDTYETERLPVAVANAAQSVYNSRKITESGLGGVGPGGLAVEDLETIEGPDGAALRERLGAAVADQLDHFLLPGLVFGHTYASAAVVDDGTPPPPTTPTAYEMSGAPGARAPHLWLTGSDGVRVSTIDLSAGTFALLAGPDGGAWVAAADALGRARGVPIRAWTVGADGDLQDEQDAWRLLYGVDPDGAVLIRPDGYVAFRAVGGSETAEQHLAPTLDAILASAPITTATNGG